MSQFVVRQDIADAWKAGELRPPSGSIAVATFAEKIVTEKVIVTKGLEEFLLLAQIDSPLLRRVLERLKDVGLLLERLDRNFNDFAFNLSETRELMRYLTRRQSEADREYVQPFLSESQKKASAEPYTKPSRSETGSESNLSKINRIALVADVGGASYLGGLRSGAASPSPVGSLRGDWSSLGPRTLQPTVSVQSVGPVGQTPGGSMIQSDLPVGRRLLQEGQTAPRARQMGTAQTGETVYLKPGQVYEDASGQIIVSIPPDPAPTKDAESQREPAQRPIGTYPSLPLKLGPESKDLQQVPEIGKLDGTRPIRPGSYPADDQDLGVFFSPDPSYGAQGQIQSSTRSKAWLRSQAFMTPSAFTGGEIISRDGIPMQFSEEAGGFRTLTRSEGWEFGSAAARSLDLPLVSGGAAGPGGQFAGVPDVGSPLGAGFDFRQMQSGQLQTSLNGGNRLAQTATLLMPNRPEQVDGGSTGRVGRKSKGSSQQQEAIPSGLGQISVFSSPMRVASPESEQRGLATSISVGSLAKRAGALDASGLQALHASLPPGATFVYPALPTSELPPGAANLSLAPSLVHQVLGKGYGVDSNQVSSSLLGSSPQSKFESPVSEPIGASLVPGKRPLSRSGSIFGSVESGKTDATEEAGGGMASRDSSLGFLGVPVKLAPSLSGRPELRTQVEAKRALAEEGETTSVKPQAFEGIRNKLFTAPPSIEAEPDKTEWEKARPSFNLASSSPASLFSSTARSKPLSSTEAMPQQHAVAMPSDFGAGQPLSSPKLNSLGAGLNLGRNHSALSDDSPSHDHPAVQSAKMDESRTLPGKSFLGGPQDFAEKVASQFKTADILSTGAAAAHSAKQTQQPSDTGRPMPVASSGGAVSILGRTAGAPTPEVAESAGGRARPTMPTWSGSTPSVQNPVSALQTKGITSNLPTPPSPRSPQIPDLSLTSPSRHEITLEERPSMLASARMPKPADVIPARPYVPIEVKRVAMPPSAVPGVVQPAPRSSGDSHSHEDGDAIQLSAGRRPKGAGKTKPKPQNAPTMQPQDATKAVGEVQIIANEVYSIIKRKLAFEADRRGRW